MVTGLRMAAPSITPHLVTLLPLNSGIAWCLWGIAALNPRLMSATPPGSNALGCRHLLALAVTLFATCLACAEPALPSSLRGVRFDQKLGAQVPLELIFRDETGNTVTLADCFQDKPVILVFAYFRCPRLCHEVMNGLVRCLLDVPFDVGKDFNVVTVSFDARETPGQATAIKKTLLERYGRAGAEAGWHVLTGSEDAIKQLADAVGFRFTYDALHDQFAHASGIVVLTPTGKAARYFYDVRFVPRDVRLALVEASSQQIGTVADQVLLYCFHYDPVEGRYGPLVMRLVRLGGVLTLMGIAIFVYVLWRRERCRTAFLSRPC